MGRYCLINTTENPYNGLSAYINTAHAVLRASGIAVEIVNYHPSKGISLAGHGSKNLETRIGRNDILELPDSRTLLLSKNLLSRSHVRMHAPINYLNYLNHVIPDYQRGTNQIKLIETSAIASSPSSNNLQKYVEFGLNPERKVHIFSNPVPEPQDFDHKKKDIDVIYIGRPERNKGPDLFSKIAKHLPKSMRIVTIGINPEIFGLAEFDNDLSCSEILNKSEIYKLLRRSRVCAVPSRFESFSMVAAEAVSFGCYVTAWNTGGIPESFPQNLVKCAEPFSTKQFAENIMNFLDLSSFDTRAAETFIKSSNADYVSNIKEFMTLCRTEENAGEHTRERYQQTTFSSRTFSRPRQKFRKLIFSPRIFIADAFKKRKFTRESNNYD